ncbi:MAG: hypothetical protein QXS38_01700 [Candidatus Pacearchaeota archaeon]
MNKINKKAAMELSMGTIVILVLGVSMLILGMILIRNIMCSGISITEDLSTGVKNEIKTLFGADRFGVKCLGEGGQDVKLGTGGRRKVICMIKTEEQVNYDIQIKNIESLSGAKIDSVNKWVISKGWTGSVTPGAEKEVTVLLLNVPRDAPATTLKITIQSKNVNTGSEETIDSIIDIVPVGFIKGAIC